MCEMPDVYDEARKKARKNHKCCECKKEIKKGDSYIYIHGLWNDKWDSYHMCEECEEVKDYIYKKYYSDYGSDGMPAIGEVHEWIKETEG